VASVHWYFRKKKFRKYFATWDSNTIILNHVNQKVAGYYECEGISKETHMKFVARATLKVPSMIEKATERRWWERWGSWEEVGMGERVGEVGSVGRWVGIGHSFISLQTLRDNHW